MDITNLLTDSAVLQELGERIAQHRLNKNLTQAQLADEAGVSLSTLNRMEAGNSSQTSNLTRVLRALELLENADLLVPPPPLSPIQQARMQGKARQRARPSKVARKAKNEGLWSWGIPEDQQSSDDINKRIKNSSIKQDDEKRGPK